MNKLYKLLAPTEFEIPEGTEITQISYKLKNRRIKVSLEHDRVVIEMKKLIPEVELDMWNARKSAHYLVKERVLYSHFVFSLGAVECLSHFIQHIVMDKGTPEEIVKIRHHYSPISDYKLQEDEVLR